jgi:hypothetical protein
VLRLVSGLAILAAAQPEVQALHVSMLCTWAPWFKPLLLRICGLPYTPGTWGPSAPSTSNIVYLVALAVGAVLVCITA